MIPYIVISIIAYLLGSISFSVIFGKKFAGIDVREKGSKNAGTTNTLRVAGKKAAILTLICDIAKGAIAVVIAIVSLEILKDTITIDEVLIKYLAGFFAIIGHTFPIFFKFRGGKGVATALGVLITLSPKIGLICLIFALVIIMITKMVSVGSILSAILYPILIIFMSESSSIWEILLSILIALLVIFNHRGNIKRIKNGTESKLSLKK